jgi:hypothetical protein
MSEAIVSESSVVEPEVASDSKASATASSILFSWLAEFAWFFCGISAFESAEVSSFSQVFTFSFRN